MNYLLIYNSLHFSFLVIINFSLLIINYLCMLIHLLVLYLLVVKTN